MKRMVQAGDQILVYTLIQTARRDVLIQALEGGLTRVYAPKTARLKEIDDLVRSRSAEILAMAERLKPKPLRDGDTIRVEGRDCLVRIRAGEQSASYAEDCLNLSFPDPDNSDALRALARECLAALALERIRDAINFYLPRTGGQIGRVTVRAQHSRWGSCSERHNLSFNWRLILAPPPCLTYVVIHELCHLTEFNHSPRFWSLVEKQMPDYQVWKDYLSANGAGLTF